MKKQLKVQAFLTIITIIVLLLSFSVSTYAWFTFSPDVNVEPMRGNIGETDGSLLICATRDGEYDTECNLIANQITGLFPLSTGDLTHFFAAAGQDANDVITAFMPADDRVETDALHGHVYLKSTRKTNDVYLDLQELRFGNDAQAMLSMRLGLRITAQGQTRTFIFRLDDALFRLGTWETLSSRTIPIADGNWVVRSADGLDLMADPALNLRDYTVTRDDDEALVPGTHMLLSLEADEIADVEFWLYLEGCDDNCFNYVQQRDVSLQLAFCGIPQKAEEAENTAQNPD